VRFICTLVEERGYHWKVWIYYDCRGVEFVKGIDYGVFCFWKLKLLCFMLCSLVISEKFG